MISGRVSRRAFLRWAGMGAVGAFLAACGPAPTPQIVEKVVEKEVTKIIEGTPVVQTVKETVVVEAPKEKVTIRYAMYGGWWSDPYKNELLPLFTKSYPNIEVKWEEAPWDQFWPRFESQAAAGIAPDTAIGDPFMFARYADKGIYLACDPLIERDGFKMGDFAKAAAEACMYEVTTGLVGQGVVYGLPSTYVGTVLYYNKDLFDAAGVSYPDDKWTRDELVDAALKLTKDKNGKRATESGFDPNNVDVFGCAVADGGYGTATNLWNNGGGLVSDDQKQCWINKPESVEIFQWDQDLVWKLRANPAQAWFQGQPDTFLTGKIAMKYDGTWNVDYYCKEFQGRWDIANPVLGTKGLPRITYCGTNTNHIYAQTKHYDEAWTFLKWTTGPEGMTWFCKMGPPALISIADSVYAKESCPEHRKIATDIGGYSHNYYPHLGNDRWKQVYNQEIQAVYLNKAPAQQVCDKICSLVQPILDKPKE